jgi:dihydropyrimidine dehydrogenase (NAD+) subunit PreT
MSSAEQFAELLPPFTSQEAVVEANRCLYCFDAPCTNACPTHIDVPRFIKKIATGNLKGSADAILEANILGLSCSRVCPVEVLCEGACVLHAHSRNPIEIGRLQRHAMEHFYSHGPSRPIPTRETHFKVACVGAGPASLSCAAELRANGIAVTVFDKRPRGGGLNTFGVAEYKFRASDSDREVEFIRSLGVDFRYGVEIGVDLTLEQLETDYDAIFIGAGLGKAKPLGVPGEDLDGVTDALHFIASYKAGQNVTVGRRVVVVGGGNTAIDAAIAAKLLGAEEVTIVYRRGERVMPAFAFEYEHAKREGIRFLWHTHVTKINGASHVENVICLPSSEVECETVIIAAGQVHDGRILADPLTGQTDKPKYFAAGDCVNGGREVVDAVAGGKRAAKGIVKWLT